jgi:hypothetical protein
MSNEERAALALLVDIEDRLFQVLQLDPWERCLYYYLLRHSQGTDRMVQVALAPAARASGMSEVKIRKTIRGMAAKGCVRIDERGRSGHLVRVLLPDEIERVRNAGVPVEAVDIDAIDFYANRRHVAAVLVREDHACFYCRRGLTEETAVLDHVVADVVGGGNSHRNVVAACHECNSTKQAEAADAFLRSLYRRGVLSQTDLESRLAHLARLQEGSLPIIIASSS